MLTNNLKELINEVKEEKKRISEEQKNGKNLKRQRSVSKKRKMLGATAVELFA